MTNPPPTPPAPGSATPTLNVKAVLAFVIAFVGLFTCPLLGAVIGVILGGQAKTEIDRSGGMQTGRGLATAGVVIGWIAVVVFLVASVIIAIMFAF